MQITGGHKKMTRRRNKVCDHQRIYEMKIHAIYVMFICLKTLTECCIFQKNDSALINSYIVLRIEGYNGTTNAIIQVVVIER